MKHERWKPHGGGKVTLPLSRHLELIGAGVRTRGVDGQGQLPSIAVVQNDWTGLRTFTTCGRSFASRSDAMRYRSKWLIAHPIAREETVAVHVVDGSACGLSCLPCAYGLYGACGRTRDSTAGALQMAAALSSVRPEYTELLPTITTGLLPVGGSASQPAQQPQLEHSEAFMRTMHIVSRTSELRPGVGRKNDVGTSVSSADREYVTSRVPPCLF
jgi:hypothetical protein